MILTHLLLINTTELNEKAVGNELTDNPITKSIEELKQETFNQAIKSLENMQSALHTANLLKTLLNSELTEENYKIVLGTINKKLPDIEGETYISQIYSIIFETLPKSEFKKKEQTNTTSSKTTNKKNSIKNIIIEILKSFKTKVV